jgi:hypothetical protein
MTSPSGSIYIENRIGPSIDPCGTPYLILEIDEE